MAKEPISYLTDRLRAERMLSSEDIDTLRTLLEIRNKLVHFGSGVSRETLESGLQRADRILKRLEVSA
jgi:uncharacterized protein YutE (UPF0331/DUF86 family)